MTTIETVERVHIAPLRARVDGMLDQVQVMTEKVRHAQDSMSDALRHVTGTGSAVAGAVKSKAWPIVGIFQGLKSVANSVIGNGRDDHAGQALSSACNFPLHISRHTFREISAIFCGYGRCNKTLDPDSLPDSSEPLPLMCGAPQAREAPSGRLLSPFHADSRAFSRNGDGRSGGRLG